MLFLGLIKRYWLPKTTAKIQVQCLSYFLLRKRNFHIRKLLKTFNLIFSKKKKTTHRLDFCPKPLNVPLNFPLKNQSLIKQWSYIVDSENFSVFGFFCPFRESLCPRILSKYADRESLCLYIVSELVICKSLYLWNAKMSRFDRTAKLSVPQNILYCTTIFYEILILHLQKNSLFI